jgi:hypothetical protein
MLNVVFSNNNKIVNTNASVYTCNKYLEEAKEDFERGAVISRFKRFQRLLRKNGYNAIVSDFISTKFSTKE